MSETLPEVPAETGAVETVEEPGWSGPSAEEWQATQERLAQYEQMLQPPQQPQYQPPEQGPPIPDPFADDYAQQFQQYTEALMAPYQQFQQQVQLAAAEEQAMEILNQNAQAGGEFDRNMAWARANQILTENGGDPVKALEQAAKETREYERRVGEAYYQQQITQLQGVAGAPRGIPAGQPGAQTAPVGGYGTGPKAVTNRLFGHSV